MFGCTFHRKKKSTNNCRYVKRPESKRIQNSQFIYYHNLGMLLWTFSSNLSCKIGLDAKKNVQLTHFIFLRILGALTSVQIILHLNEIGASSMSLLLWINFSSNDLAERLSPEPSNRRLIVTSLQKLNWSNMRTCTVYL